MLFTIVRPLPGRFQVVSKARAHEDILDDAPNVIDQGAQFSAPPACAAVAAPCAVDQPQQTERTLAPSCQVTRARPPAPGARRPARNSPFRRDAGNLGDVVAADEFAAARLA